MFVGEIKGEEVVGFHNWICFYLQEKAGNIDYHGYFRRGTVSSVRSHLSRLPVSSCYFEIFLWEFAGDLGLPRGDFE